MADENVEELVQEEVGEALGEKEQEEIDENAHLAPQWFNPIPQSSDDPEETEEDRLLFYKQQIKDHY